MKATFVSESGYYDVQSIPGHKSDQEIFVQDVKATSSDEALRLVAAQKKGHSERPCGL